jgi:hypothetical protein
MKSSRIGRNLGVVAILLASGFFMSSSVAGSKQGKRASTRQGQIGAAVILQADGGAPPPPPKPPKPSTRSTSVA